MRRRAPATVITAVLVVAVAVAAALALPRSRHSIAHIAVGGAPPGPRPALDMLGRAGTTPSDSDTTAPSAPTPATAAGAASATSPSTATSTAPRPPTTGRPLSSLPTNAAAAAAAAAGMTATTAVAQVAPAGPATGRLAVTIVSPSGARSIATMAADGSGERVLATGNYIDPHWSPDGRVVLFESMGAYAQLQVPAAGGPVSNLGDGAVAIVSPDGTRIINVMAVPGTTSPPPLTVQNVAETSSGLVTVGPATPLGVSGVGAVWSPDGRRIVYATAMGGTSDLAVVNADGTGRHDLLGSAAVKASGVDHPGFSADGSTISFLGSDSTVYFVGVDGQHLRPALPGAVAGVSSLGAFATNWSADHQRLAVLVNGGNSVVVVDTADQVLATAHLSVLAFPVGIAFDGGGQHVFYMGAPGSPPQSPRLYSVALGGGTSGRVGGDDSAGFPLSVLAG